MLIPLFAQQRNSVSLNHPQVADTTRNILDTLDTLHNLDTLVVLDTLHSSDTLDTLATLDTNKVEKETKDSLVRLVSAASAQIVEIDGISYRKVFGPATFEHNKTFLLCDTALWNVGINVIEAFGNVKIVQGQTELTSDKMVYYVDSSLAEFRGSLVQLQDSVKNTLRTRYLDYNTKDSIAIFKNGAAMRDKDGQIIESLSGKYTSKEKTFLFEDEVNMFTDSIFVKTTELLYESDISRANFGTRTNVWKDDNMLSSEAGWYVKGPEIFLFYDDVHVMSPTQEGWSDSLYFYRNDMVIKMYGNAQVSDTTKNVSALAGEIIYVDSLSKISLTRDPSVALQTKNENEQIDTMFFGADTLLYYTEKFCEIDSLYLEEAKKRKTSLEVDPIANFRKKAAEEAAKKAAEEAMKDPNNAANYIKNKKDKIGLPPEEPTAKDENTPNTANISADTVTDSTNVAIDSTNVVTDSTNVAIDSTNVVTDSTRVATDSSDVEKRDTTKMGFLTAIKNVKVFRTDIQAVCDSLVYSDVDSLARLFNGPIIWDEITREYISDSIYVVVKNNAVEKANLISNAFVHIMQDSLHYNQINGAEMMAYFGEGKGLRRFDALGGASALFYIEENGDLATVNKKESKMLTASFVDGNINKIYYYDQPKSDAYPVVQLSEDEKKLKGYNWQPDLRPKDRYDITEIELRTPERSSYVSVPKAKYVQANIYFPGYIDDINRQIAFRDSMNIVRERENELRKIREKELAKIKADSLVIADSLFRVDSLFKADSISHLKDSLAKLKADSLKVVNDSLAKAEVTELEQKSKLTWRERITLVKKKIKERREARIAEREKKWEELDKRDEERKKARLEKKQKRRKKKEAELLRNAEEQALRDAELLEKYKEKYRKRYAKKLLELEKNSPVGIPPENLERIKKESSKNSSK